MMWNTYAISCLLGPKEFETVILVVDCVQSEVAKVVESQHSLERQLELIETHQQEIEKSLESMEDEAERIYRDERPTLVEDEAAATRDMM
jgi:nuclear pore complex protein Nup62